MRLHVRCKTCGLDAGSCDFPHAGVWQALPLAAHSAPPHQAPHVLEAQASHEDDSEHEISIRCLHNECRAKGKDLTVVKSSLWLAGVVAITHHSGHEGHPLEVSIDGKFLCRTPK